MKKMFSLIIVLSVLITFISACASCSHTEEEIWMADVNEHWKVCSECDEKLLSGKHTINDILRCDVCNSEISVWNEYATIFTYDEQGNNIRRIEYDTDGNLVTEAVYEHMFDSDGNIVKTTTYIDSKLKNETEYTVDGDERLLTRSVNYRDDGTKFLEEYNVYGNVIRSIDYDADGNENQQTYSEYEQNSYGNWYTSTHTEIYSDGKKVVTEYNQYLDTTSRVIYDAQGKVTSSQKWEFVYNDNGSVSTLNEYVDGKIAKESVYKMHIDEEGMYNYPETVITYNEDGSKTVCVYNENDKLVSERKYDASDNLVI